MSRGSCYQSPVRRLIRLEWIKSCSSEEIELFGEAWGEFLETKISLSSALLAGGVRGRPLVRRRSLCQGNREPYVKKKTNQKHLKRIQQLQTPGSSCQPEQLPCSVRTSVLCFSHSLHEFILTSLRAAASEGINDEISLDRLDYRDQQQLLSNFDKYTLKMSSTRDGMFKLTLICFPCINNRKRQNAASSSTGRFHATVSSSVLHCMYPGGKSVNIRPTTTTNPQCGRGRLEAPDKPGVTYCRSILSTSLPNCKVSCQHIIKQRWCSAELPLDPGDIQSFGKASLAFCLICKLLAAARRQTSPSSSICANFSHFPFCDYSRISAFRTKVPVFDAVHHPG